MKRVIYIIALCMALSHASIAQDYDNYTITRVSEDEYDAAIKRNYTISIDTLHKINKYDSFLILPINGDQSVVLKDTIAQITPGMVEYKYLGVLSYFNAYVVQAKYEITCVKWLINKSDGKITKMFRYIVPSKYGIISYATRSNGRLGSVEIFVNKTNRLSLCCCVESEFWIPRNVVWASKHSFIIKAHEHFTDDYVYYKVDFKRRDDHLKKQSSCVLLIPYHQPIPLTDRKGVITDYIINDTIKEDYQSLVIKKVRRDKAYVEASAILYDTIPKYGWIELKYLEIYPKTQPSIQLYKRPNMTAKVQSRIKNVWYSRPFHILDCKRDWLYVSYLDEDNIIKEGWMAPRDQCADPYSMCAGSLMQSSEDY